MGCAVNRAHVLELVRFGVVGLFNAGTYFGLYAVWVLLGVPFALAALIAFTISASIGYWLHEHWTFGGGSPTVTGLGKWLTAQGLSMGSNVGLLAIGVAALSADPIIAQLVLLPVMPLATYLVGRRWVFTRTGAA
jgi:putative flippase GtrA